MLQATLSGERKGALTFALFDLLHLDGVDITRAPLIERKGLLKRLLTKPPKGLAYSSHVVGNGIKAFEGAAAKGFEGIISKRASSTYHGGRGDDWVKAKHLPSDEFAVVGYTPGKGGRKGVGSLLLAKPHPEHGWIYSGKVGTGFDNEMLRQLTKKIGDKGTPTPTVYLPEDRAKELRASLWFKPSFVVEVFLRGIGGQGVLRQPSFKALRPDKKLADLRDSDRA